MGVRDQSLSNFDQGYLEIDDALRFKPCLLDSKPHICQSNQAKAKVNYLNFWHISPSQFVEERVENPF